MSMTIPLPASSAPTSRATGRRATAYEYVRDRIVRGLDGPGTLLSENELALTLGLSRQPVREALLLIAQEGLVEVRPQSGTYVSLIDPDLVKQAQFIREAIEATSLETCVDKLGPDDERDLREILRQQEAAADRDAFYPLDEAFHRRLLAIAGHEYAWASVSNAKGHLDRARYLGLSGFRSIGEYTDDHRRVVDALVEGDLEQAKRELRGHLRFVLSDIARIEDEHPEYFTRPSVVRRSGRPARV
jgi:DNA-binding GntR family transcriptional regulator